MEQADRLRVESLLTTAFGDRLTSEVGGEPKQTYFFATVNLSIVQRGDGKSVSLFSSYWCSFLCTSPFASSLSDCVLNFCYVTGH